MKRALVLSGGGAKGSFEVGALEELILNRGVDFDILTGVSVGALNAAFLAQAPLSGDVATLGEWFKELRHLWLDEITGCASIFSVRSGDLGAALGADSIYDPTPLRDLLDRHLSRSKIATSGRKLLVPYVCLETGQLWTATNEDPEIVQHVLASSTMPFYFPPVNLRGHHLIDGGIRDITPLSKAFEEGADVIYIVYTSPFDLDHAEFVDNWIGTRINAFSYLARAVEIMSNEVYLNDVGGAQRFNTIKSCWDQLRDFLPHDHPAYQELDAILHDYKYAKIIEIHPDCNVIKDSLNFSPTKIRECYEYGRRIAAQVMDDLAPNLPEIIEEHSNE